MIFERNFSVFAHYFDPQYGGERETARLARTVVESIEESPLTRHDRHDATRHDI